MKDRLLRGSMRIVLILMLALVGLLWWFGHPAHPGHTAELPIILVSTTWDTILIMLSSIGIGSTIRRFLAHAKKA